MNLAITSSVIAVSAFVVAPVQAATLSQPLAPGWDVFNEQLNYNTSNVTWEVRPELVA